MKNLQLYLDYYSMNEESKKGFMFRVSIDLYINVEIRSTSFI